MKWLLLLTKRNFKKISFLFILLLIPTVSLVITQMTRNAGISKVGYVCDGKEDEMTSDIFDTLSEGAGILSMKQYNTAKITNVNAAKIGDALYTCKIASIAQNKIKIVL